MEISPRDRCVGCLVGGAVGDALGAAVEFSSWAEIAATFGPEGIADPAPAYGHPCPITDDTQMTLFTAEGLLRARATGADDPVPSIHRAYLRWLHTQGARSHHPDFDDALDGWLVREPGLHSARAPGNTCIGGLTSAVAGTIDAPLNDSKGCGGVMRIAPVALLWPDPVDVAARACALTHGHDSGWRAGGALAAILADVRAGRTLAEATRAAAASEIATGEVAEALRTALALVDAGPPTVARVESLGAGWVAEEALAIAVYCALAAPDLAAAVRAAVNHSGDSDSTGSIAGQLRGAVEGPNAIPRAWTEPLELRDLIVTIAEDLAAAATGTAPPPDRYPAG